MTAFIVFQRLWYAGFSFLFVSMNFMISFFASALTHLSFGHVLLLYMWASKCAIAPAAVDLQMCSTVIRSKALFIKIFLFPNIQYILEKSPKSPEGKKNGFYLVWVEYSVDVY